MKVTMIKRGKTYYDERNDRYLVPDGHGCDPKCWRCSEYEMNADGDLILVDMVLMMAGELAKMKEV